MEAKLKEKRWNTEFEKELYSKWEEEKLFKFNKDSGKEIFVIDNPPVYPSGHWHPGAVAAYSYIDMIARSERMKGKEVRFPFCLDNNGLPIETAVEKKYGKKAYEMEREEFLSLCKKLIREYGDEIYNVYKMIGLSADFDDYYYTDMEEYRALTQATFIELWNKGLIYEDEKPNNWCTGCKTTIADAEIEYKEGTTTLNHLVFKVKETGEKIIIATTRSELLCACQVVLFNPEDERYQKLEGKHAVIPLYGREVPIRQHHSADPNYGSGLVMVCSYGDSTDVQIFRELRLEPIKAIDKDRKMTEAAGKYAGLDVLEAREKIIEDLKKEGLLLKQEQVPHRAPHCDRCGAPIEIISMKEWYLKQLDFLEDIKKIADEITFHPEKHKQILLDWVNSITIDWPISRRRYYATEIPLWYCKECVEPFVPPPGRYYQPWKEDPPEGSKCECGSTEFIGETRVFDTWMDSSISNLYVTGYKRDEELFKKAFPCSMRPQGRDIVRTWLFYTLLRSYQLTGKPGFKHVMIHGMGLDEHGRKMSKSKGNFISPEEMLSKYGADAYRLWAASEASIGEDFRISEDRIKGASKFLTKLWNVARFISSFDNPEDPGELKNSDRWILAELNELVKESRKAYDDYNFFIPAVKTREFVWNVFASHYIEMVKPRAYEGDKAALSTLHTVMRTVLKLLAPITPFITDKIYRDVYGETVHSKKLPEENAGWDSSFKKLTNKIIEFNSEVWKKKKEARLPLNNEITGIQIPVELKPLEEDLIRMHNLK